jgi:membrane dipeptidase
VRYARPVPPVDEALLTRARELHRRVPVVDGHADSILDVLDGKRSLAERSGEGHLDFPRAREGGLSCTVQTAWPAPAHYPVAAARVLVQLDGLLSEVERAGPDVRLVTTAAEVRACHRDGVLGVMLNVEGAEALHGEIGVLGALYRLGVRVLQPVWNHRNAAADGVEDGEGGLSNFGRSLVREMNRLGMAIDLSHVTRAGFLEVLDLSEDPVLFTHGNCRELFDHRRNLTDEQIKALAEHGGVFGISLVKAFMAKGAEAGSRHAAVEALRAAPGGVGLVADHVERVVQLVGPDHVAYGSDFDGTDVLPTGLDDVTFLPHLTAELMARGYSDADLTKIVGGNFLRVFEAIFGG